MNWFRKLANARRDQYLRNLGANEQVIQYVNSIADQKIVQLLVNEIRKNPSIDIDQLQQMNLSQQSQQIDPYTKFEHNIAKQCDPLISQWAIVQMKKHRKSQKRDFPDNSMQMMFGDYDFSNVVRIFLQTHQEWNILQLFNEIEDWVRYTYAQINNYSFESAAEASRIWHEEISKAGNATAYQERNIIYPQRQWLNKKFNGWTIQEIKTANDLEFEGECMDHCVGSYNDEVAKGHCRIFSLRDPQNKPHVTIETNGSGDIVRQIQGFKNSTPKPEYKEMIKEWIQSKLNAPSISNEEEYDDLISLIKDSNIRDISDLLDGWGDVTDEYGLKKENTLPDFRDTYNAIYKELSGRRSDSNYYPWMRSIAHSLVDLYVRKGEEQMAEKELYKLEEEFYDHVLNYSADMVDEPYPSEDDFETKEEYDVAEESWRQKEQEAIDNVFEYNFPYAFVNDCFKRINSVKEREEREKQLTSK